MECAVPPLGPCKSHDPTTTMEREANAAEILGQNPKLVWN